MTASHVLLRTFSESELIFDEEETRCILGFFFPQYRQRVEAASITNDLRNSAQGLLVDSIHRRGVLQPAWPSRADLGLK